MYQYSDIRTVHLEITTRCNARCPQCPRNLWGAAVNPSLPLAELSLGDCEKLFPPDFVRQLRQLYMCGNYGDPVVAADTFEVFAYLRRCSDAVALRMHTNGGARASEWWAALAKVGCAVRFAIDGLEDTNHLYRRGTLWSAVIGNAESFIRAGGRAEWSFIVFRHNEHQVERARKLAGEMGFKRFIVKRTKRFLDSDRGTKLRSLPVLGRGGEVEYELEPPEDPAYQIPLSEPWLEGRGGGYEEYLRTAPITCKAVKERTVYVSAEGLALPCCWLGHLYPREFQESRPQVWSLIDRLPGKLEALNALRHGLRRVVEGDFFGREVPSHWEPSGAGRGRLRVCAQVCGDMSVQDNQNAEYAV